MQAATPGTVIFRDRDQFGTVLVSESGGKRLLSFDDGAVQSAMVVATPAFPVLEYGRALACGLVLCPTPRRILMVGLGGGNLVHFFLAHCPGVILEVVELQPAVIRAARTCFGIDELLAAEGGRLTIHQGAGQDVIARRLATGATYDLVLLDAFDDHGPAAALLAEEVLRAGRRLLTGSGLLVANLWNRPQDDFPAYGERFRRVFPPEGVLQLALGEAYRNVLLFGLANVDTGRRLERLRPQAKALGERLGFNLRKYWRQLCWQNHRPA